MNEKPRMKKIGDYWTIIVDGKVMSSWPTPEMTLERFYDWNPKLEDEKSNEHV